jgi:7,8-dihydroneopterin aldolase/epimerase/oxygenase
MTDRILVDGLTFYGHHGVGEAEQAVGGRYRMDLALMRDLSAAGRSDRLEDTTNYSQAVRVALEVGTGRRFRLLEAMAAAVADEILARCAVDGVTVRVTKLHPPLPELLTGTAAVEITRWRAAAAPGAEKEGL